MIPTAAALADLAARFRHFAAVECTQDPLYVALCLAVADSPEMLALLAEAPKTQAHPNLLLAALHERVLAGVAHPLASYYPSVGGQRMPDAELPAVLLDFARRERVSLVAHLRTRSTQTNEIGRCAVLWPALQHIAASTGKPELALFDFGSSAGLNLGVDDYRYRYLRAKGCFEAGALAAAQRPLIECQWLGSAPPLSVGDWRLVERIGADPAAIDVQDAHARRWLAACLWPHDRERAARLQQALALAQQRPRRVLQADDCLDALEDWLHELPSGLQPIVFNSWVLHYLDPSALAQMRQRLAALMQQGDLVWLSAEAPQLRPAGLELPDLAEGATASTLWTLQWAESGALQQRALAWSHPHGRWLQWLA
ncbi:DUF2332 domain-containing protein [Paucibacter sp. Y2R2-4]|uniref:DUF2332 domain-containing protein n=1 Tax=Paucibacter sp. Y2R2-4 TaxID=2893553 RepID=UPI0021E37946|nr:DUF2332 domain-containing protein [Paucibacter sp. Y2R2-4]MCV2350708.1 DUF2332 domain-containing protein [Paucibacter sp. Y2R2-4]